MTLKLHLAAMHLADQLRACGPGFKQGEFWIERMVQLIKHLAKFRSTWCPELIATGDCALDAACRNVSRTTEGRNLLSLDDAVYERRNRRTIRHDEQVGDGAVLLGAGVPCNAVERDTILVPCLTASPADLKGLAYLLYHDPTIQQGDGWRCHEGEPTAERVRSIVSDLGLQNVDGQGNQSARVRLTRFKRAEQAGGERFSSILCKAQKRSDNQWALIKYIELHEDGSVAGHSYNIVHFQYFVRAEYTDDTGVALANPLKLGVAKVYTCDAVEGCGVRAPEELVGGLPELFRVSGFETDAQCIGTLTLDLRNLDVQVVPTVAREGTRLFSIANKLSSRIYSVRRR